MVASSTGSFEQSSSGGDRDDAPLAANLVGGADPDRMRAHAGGGYSRFVAWMKVVLPIFAVGLVALVLAWPRLKTDETFRIGFASVSLTGETESGMDNARYVGTDENRRPFSVTADLARMVNADGSVVNLELPKADLTMENGTWLVMTADTGRYAREDHVLDLVGGVNLFHDTGYEMSTEQLSVDLEAGSATGDAPLSGHGPFGELKSQGIQMIDKGRVIHFTGPARLVLYPPENP